LSRMTCRTTGDSYRTWVIVGNMVSTKEVVLMKNFTKKLALLLVFAMVLGVVTPTSVAKAADGDFTFNYDEMYFTVEKSGNALADFEYTQYVPKTDTAPTEKEAKEIKDKDWIVIDSELNGSNGQADMSWFNKKKDSYVIVKYTDNGTTKYAISGKIKAQAAALKVAFVNKNAASATNKLPAYTATDVVGSAEAGYLLFYKAGATKGTFVVVTPGAVSFRYDNGHKFYEASDLNTKLAKYLAKGATLLFSEAKAGANPNNTTWATAETKYKYAAQKSAPTVKVGIDHLVPLKLGQQYRIVNASNNKHSDWTLVDEFHTTESGGKKKVNKVYLEQLIVSGGGIEAGTFANADKTLKASAIAGGNVKLQVRTAATAKGVASKTYSFVVSEAAIKNDIASTASIKYAVAYDKSKGITVKNVTKDNIEYCLSTTTSAVALSNKWKAVKAEKEATIKATEIKDTKKNVEYKYILVRVAGDKKAGILSSDFKSVEINNNNLGYNEQTISGVAETTLAGNDKVKYSVTTAGAVTVKVTVANVSEDAISAKIPVTVSNMVKPDIKKWDKKGSAKGYTIALPEYKTNTITFEFKVEKGQTEGNSGEYKVKVEGLDFVFKVEVTK